MDALLDAGLLEAGLVLEIRDSQPSLDLLTSLMDELACGLMVVTHDGAVLQANRAARSELARTGLLQPAGNLWMASTQEHAKTMQESFAKAAAGGRSLVALSNDAAKLTMAVIPLKGRPRLPACVALVFSRSSVHEPQMLGLFARSHGLTVTEEHVLGILCQGYSAPDVASQMKVAVSTIRTHVRSMCAKTRSSGVRELVSRVAVLPPVITPPPEAQAHDQIH